jgi:hypothetical protein
MGGLFGSSKAPTPPPPVPPSSAPVTEATFTPGDEGTKKQKKLTAIKKGKGRLAISTKSGVKSGVSKGY